MFQFGEAFDSLSPVVYDAGTGATLNNARLYTQIVNNRMQPFWGKTSSSKTSNASMPNNLKGHLFAFNGPDAAIGGLLSGKPQADDRRGWGLWGDVFGQWGDQDSDDGDGFVGYDYDSYGAVFGADYTMRERWIVGLSFGYSNTDLDFDSNGGDGDIDSYYGSLYASFYPGKFYFDSILTYGRQDYDNSRDIVVGNTRSTANSDHDGDLYSAFLEGGYNFGRGNWWIGPFASLQYTYLDEDEFKESGADVLNQEVEDRQTDALVSQLGLRAANLIDTNIGTLIPEFRAAWLYDYDLDDRTVTSALAGASGDSFSVDGQDVEQNGLIIGAELTLVQENGFSSSIGYGAEFRDDYDAHAVVGQIRFEF